MAGTPTVIAVDPDLYDLEHSQYLKNYISSETTSLDSLIYRGVFENGRRYQSLREGEYWCPCDEQQFESFQACHLLCSLMDANTENALFQSPVRDPKNILDIGTGRGNWAVDVADMFPKAVVRGVDLFPPPLDWLPPNCIMEVDDILQEWTWRTPFDLIHLRQMIGAFTPEQWDSVFAQCYKNLKPGGWIEQIEMDPQIVCTDNSIPPNSSILQYSCTVRQAAERSNHPLDTANTMRSAMSKAGFIDIHEKKYTWPIGPWARDQTLKEAGRLHHQQWSIGMEGWALYFLTRWGVPTPWTKDEIQVLIAKARVELNDPKLHMWQRARRVWGRRATEEEVGVNGGRAEIVVSSSSELIHDVLRGSASKRQPSVGI